MSGCVLAGSAFAVFTYTVCAGIVAIWAFTECVVTGWAGAVYTIADGADIVAVITLAGGALVVVSIVFAVCVTVMKVVDVI